ncbi:hypothetical protein [Actinomadura oligospora]|uniref:hypothetical protein n=1 Tax=Actinomadura oligospora TaxID=111804 RepID=UPI0012FAA7AE|nr:hypothetical protein [Actinomadura oligospora]
MHEKSVSAGSPGAASSSATSSLDELKAAYQAQLAHLAAERDEARRQARRAKAEADVARANLASLQARVDRLLGSVRDQLGLPLATDADLAQKGTGKAADASAEADAEPSAKAEKPKRAGQAD